MKNIKRIIFIMATFCLLINCSDDLPMPLGKTLKNPTSKPVTVTVPFKANFSVWNISDYTDTRCGGYPVFYLTMEGFGNISQLGKTSIKMAFCCNVQTGVYENANCVFVAANGDELYAEIPIGYIVPNEGDNSSYYQTRFNDPMNFTGGTGKFEGASGEATTDAFVHDGEDEWRTDFFSQGFLVLTKGQH